MSSHSVARRRYAASMTETHEEPTAAEPPYRPPTAPLRYARGDRVELRCAGTWFAGQVTVAFVTGENEIVPTYVVALDGCDGAITVTEHRLLRRAGEVFDG